MDRKFDRNQALIRIARANLLRARRNVGAAWRETQQMQMVLRKTERLRVLKPRI